MTWQTNNDNSRRRRRRRHHQHQETHPRETTSVRLSVCSKNDVCQTHCTALHACSMLKVITYTFQFSSSLSDKLDKEILRPITMKFISEIQQNPRPFYASLLSGNHHIWPPERRSENLDCRIAKVKKSVPIPDEILLTSCALSLVTSKNLLYVDRQTDSQLTGSGIRSQPASIVSYVLSVSNAPVSHKNHSKSQDGKLMLFKVSF